VVQQPRASGCAGAALWVFVSTFPQRGSFAERGMQMAELLSQHTPTRGNQSTIEAMSCEDACGAAASARFDEFLAQRCGPRRMLVTHVKWACECLLRSRPGTAALGNQQRNVFHVFDTVRPPPQHCLFQCSCEVAYSEADGGNGVCLHMAGGPGVSIHHSVDQGAGEKAALTPNELEGDAEVTRRSSCLRAETRRTALPQATSPRFDAIITPTAHLQEWLHAEIAKRNGSTPVLRVPFHHSRSSAMREPGPFHQAIRTICYYGSAPEPEMVHAVRQWADAHNATFEVRMVRDPHREEIRATSSSCPLPSPLVLAVLSWSGLRTASFDVRLRFVSS
jgi:hypothetical protein